jgi:hypothetical protein
MEVASGAPARPPGCAPANGVPHWAQKRLSAEFSVPHAVQNTPGTPFLVACLSRRLLEIVPVGSPIALPPSLVRRAAKGQREVEVYSEVTCP